MARRNTKTQEEPRIFGYKFDLKRHCDHNEEADKEFGDWSRSNSWFPGQILKKVDEYPDVTSTIDFDKGDLAYVVWVQWGSGDSFGHEDGAYAEAIAVFADPNVAQELVAHIKEQNRASLIDLDIVTSDGQHITHGCVGWAGYFESLEDVNVSEAVVAAQRK